MSEHTPGQWRAIFIDSWLLWDVDSDEGDSGINPMTGHSDRYSILDDLKEGDARLIAAAPDLLEACEAAERLIPFGIAGDQLRAAIAKAKGGVT